MAIIQTPKPGTAVLDRVIRMDGDDLSRDAALSILKLSFQQADLDRMHDLAVRGQKGELSKEEQAEIAEYRQVGLLLALLKSKARRSLKRGSSSE